VRGSPTGMPALVGVTAAEGASAGVAATAEPDTAAARPANISWRRDPAGAKEVVSEGVIRRSPGSRRHAGSARRALSIMVIEKIK